MSATADTAMQERVSLGLQQYRRARFQNAPLVTQTIPASNVNMPPKGWSDEDAVFPR
jgi:hypothetical protein